MKMARASEADINMAMELCSALDVLGQRFVPCMPEAIETLDGDDESERFDCDDDAQCGRALRHLLEIAERGSLMRVIWGMATVLDPRNELLDPDADTLEKHPKTLTALARVPVELTDEQANDIAKASFERLTGRVHPWEGAQPWVVAAIRDAANPTLTPTSPIPAE